MKEEIVQDEVVQEEVRSAPLSTYSFMVPSADCVDLNRIDCERYEDAVVAGRYASDAFIVTSKAFAITVLGVSKKFLSRFSLLDGITLCNQEFFYSPSTRVGFGFEPSKNAYYRYLYISHSEIAEAKAEIAKLRKIHVPHFKVNVSSI